MFSVVRNISKRSFFYITHRNFCKNKIEQNVKEVSKLKKSQLQKTPLGKLDEFGGRHPYQEKEPLPEFEGGINPETNEIGGPKGPEPTRYGDWERKGRVTDF